MMLQGDCKGTHGTAGIRNPYPKILMLLVLLVTH
jgi:hypothetical protein